MPFILWVPIGIFVFCAIMTFRAQLKLNRLARAQGYSVFGDDLIERPWRFWLNLRSSLSRAFASPYQQLAGSAEQARKEFLRWRWAMIGSFLAMLVVSALAAR